MPGRRQRGSAGGSKSSWTPLPSMSWSACVPCSKVIRSTSRKGESTAAELTRAGNVPRRPGKPWPCPGTDYRRSRSFPSGLLISWTEVDPGTINHEAMLTVAIRRVGPCRSQQKKRRHHRGSGPSSGAQVADVVPPTQLTVMLSGHVMSLRPASVWLCSANRCLIAGPLNLGRPHAKCSPCWSRGRFQGHL